MTFFAYTLYMSRKKKENTEEQEVKKPKTIGPFDIINMMFTKPDEFNKLSNLLLSKNFFMINRVFSIQFPLQAAVFNKLNINTADVIRCWQNFLTKQYGNKVPFFVYTKGLKKTTELQEDIEIPKDIKESYCKHYNLSLKDFDDLLYFDRTKVLDDIKIFTNNMNNKEIKKIK